MIILYFIVCSILLTYYIVDKLPRVTAISNTDKLWVFLKLRLALHTL